MRDFKKGDVVEIVSSANKTKQDCINSGWSERSSNLPDFIGQRFIVNHVTHGTVFGYNISANINHVILYQEASENHDLKKIEEPEKGYDIIDINMDDLANDCSIKTILRKKDNQIFKVGDKHLSKYMGGEIEGAIEAFEESQDTIVAKIRFKAGGSHWVGLKELEKAPEKLVLFVTEDGKEIFDGDTYFWIRDEFQITETIAEYRMEYEKCVRRFSAKKAAEEWVIQNKPVWSFNEIWIKHVLSKESMLQTTRERCGFKEEE